MSMFVACSDNDEPNIPIEKELAGTYKGTLDIAMNGSELANGLPKNVTITKAGVSTINLELKDFSFMGQNWGNIIITDCEMLKYKDRYTISGNQTLTIPSIGECAIVVDGTLIGRDITVDLDIAVAALKQTVKVTFAGAKLAGNESSEAKITSFTIDSEVITGQPTINEEAGKITFKVNEAATDEELELVPVFMISGKATVYPASGVIQDFSKGKTVVYTVVAEDGTAKEYEVSVAGSQNILKYSFDEWVAAGSGKGVYETPSPVAELATSSAGVSTLVALGFKGGYPVIKTEDARSGSAAKLVTLYTKGAGFGLAPTVTAGSLFTGSFVLNFDQLLSTKFGILYEYKPITFKGYYKYTPGAVFHDGTDKGDVIIEGKTDEFSIKATLYEVDDESETLTGKDINTSGKRIAIAEVKEGAATAVFTPFNVSFELLEGKEYDPLKKYKLAIVCSSSKLGDAFQGAPGSTLILDDLEVIGE